MTPWTPEAPTPDDARSTKLEETPLMASIRAAAFAASEIPAVPIAIVLAPSAGLVVALSSSKTVTAVLSCSPPAAVVISIVNDASADEASTPVVSRQSTAVA